jgi:hypothetical protein
MLRFFQRLGYNLLFFPLFFASYFFFAISWICARTEFVYDWLPEGPKWNRIWFFLRGVRLTVLWYVGDAEAWCVIAAARYFWLSNFVSASLEDAPTLGGK